MSLEPLALARHALGLPNDRNLSYRNRYVAPEGAPAHVHWLKMVACGWARDVFFSPRSGQPSLGSGQEGQPPAANRLGTQFVTSDHQGQPTGASFCLTLEGASYAVDPGEKLDPEDFASIDGRAA